MTGILTLCTKETPMGDDHQYVQHLDAEPINLKFKGNFKTITYKCPWCGTVFEEDMELDEIP